MAADKKGCDTLIPGFLAKITNFVMDYVAAPPIWRFCVFVTLAAISIYGKAKMLRNTPRIVRSVLWLLFPEWMQGPLPQCLQTREPEIQKFIRDKLDELYPGKWSKMLDAARISKLVGKQSLGPEAAIKVLDDGTEKLRKLLKDEVNLSSDDFDALSAHWAERPGWNGPETVGDVATFEKLRAKEMTWHEYKKSVADKSEGWLARMIVFHNYLGVWFLATVADAAPGMTSAQQFYFFAVVLKVLTYMAVCWWAAIQKHSCWFLAIDPLALATRYTLGGAKHCRSDKAYALTLALTFTLAPEVFPAAELARDIGWAFGTFYSAFLTVTDIAGIVAAYSVWVQPPTDSTWSLIFITLNVSCGFVFGATLLYWGRRVGIFHIGFANHDEGLTRVCHSRASKQVLPSILVTIFLVWIFSMGAHEWQNYSITVATCQKITDPLMQPHSHFSGCHYTPSLWLEQLGSEEKFCSCSSVCEEGWRTGGGSKTTHFRYELTLNSGTPSTKGSKNITSHCTTPVDCGPLIRGGPSTVTCSGTTLGSICHVDGVSLTCGKDGQWELDKHAGACRVSDLPASRTWDAGYTVQTTHIPEYEYSCPDWFNASFGRSHGTKQFVSPSSTCRWNPICGKQRHCQCKPDCTFWKKFDGPIVPNKCGGFTCDHQGSWRMIDKHLFASCQKQLRGNPLAIWAGRLMIVFIVCVFTCYLFFADRFCYLLMSWR